MGGGGLVEDKGLSLAAWRGQGGRREGQPAGSRMRHRYPCWCQCLLNLCARCRGDTNEADLRSAGCSPAGCPSAGRNPFSCKLSSSVPLAARRSPARRSATRLWATIVTCDAPAPSSPAADSVVGANRNGVVARPGRQRKGLAPKDREPPVTDAAASGASSSTASASPSCSPSTGAASLERGGLTSSGSAYNGMRSVGVLPTRTPAASVRWRTVGATTTTAEVRSSSASAVVTAAADSSGFLMTATSLGDAARRASPVQAAAAAAAAVGDRRRRCDRLACRRQRRPRGAL